VREFKAPNSFPSLPPELRRAITDTKLTITRGLLLPNPAEHKPAREKFVKLDIEEFELHELPWDNSRYVPKIMIPEGGE
jgi:hypothetical protein